MLRRTLLVVACLLPLAPAPSFDARTIDDAVEKSMRAWRVPGAAIAIVRADEVVYAKGYGVRELGRDDRVTPDTLFAIGSTTKAFTTAAMATLVDEGRMAWDDPVRRHLDFFHLCDPIADQAVTLRDLVTHRTGLDRNDALWYNSSWNREELLRRLAFVKPARPFRAAWQYNNLMFLAAGYAAGRAGGSTWEDLVQKRLFDPLGMKSANFDVAVAQKAPDHASPHVLRERSKREVVPWRELSNIGPAGSINASANDLARWIRLQLNGGIFEGREIISRTNFAEMHTPQMAMRPEQWGRSWSPETRQMTYGLGWTLHDYRGLHLVSHGGAIDGFRANITLVPDSKLGLVVLANLGQENMPEALRFRLIDILLRLPERDWDSELRAHFRKEAEANARRMRKRLESRQNNTRPSLDLTRYTGDFFDRAYGPLTISRENDRLVLAWSRNCSTLEHFHLDTFRAPESLVLFRLDESANVAAVTYRGVEFGRK